MYTFIEIISPNCVSEFYSRESRRNPRRMIKAAGKSLAYCLKSVTKKGIIQVKHIYQFLCNFKLCKQLKDRLFEILGSYDSVI